MQLYWIVCNCITCTQLIIYNVIQISIILNSRPGSQHFWTPGREFKIIYKQVYTIVHDCIFTIVYNCIELYTIVYNRIQSYTNVFNPIQQYTIVCNCIRLYTTVLIVHNWLYILLFKFILFWIPGREFKINSNYT